MNIQGISSYSVSSIGSCSIDSEEKEIMRRLLAYGIKPTGDKTTDRARLHELELKEAQNNNFITTKFLTISKSEQEKIQEKKKEKKSDNDIKQTVEKFEGSTALGEQIYLVLQIKNKKKTSTTS